VEPPYVISHAKRTASSKIALPVAPVASAGDRTIFSNGQAYPIAKVLRTLDHTDNDNRQSQSENRNERQKVNKRIGSQVVDRSLSLVSVSQASSASASPRVAITVKQEYYREPATFPTKDLPLVQSEPVSEPMKEDLVAQAIVAKDSQDPTNKRKPETTGVEMAADTVESAKEMRGINLRLLLCKPTARQVSSIERVVSQIKNLENTTEAVKRILVHPDAAGGVSPKDWNGIDSAKIRNLIKILQKVENSVWTLVLVSGENNEKPLKEFFQFVDPTRYGMSQCPNVHVRDFADSSLVNECFDLVVAFDLVPKVYVHLMEHILKSSCSPHYIQLISQGTIEERLFWREVMDEDSTECTSSDLEVSEISFIRDNLSSRPGRFATVPDEEFTELWPKLLDLGWHAEAGGGLVDYYYCMPGFTSKSAKGKIKGQKHVNYFSSKAKVLDFLRKDPAAGRRISQFDLGAFDLALWEVEHLSCNSKARDSLFSHMTELDLCSVYSCERGLRLE
jgi:hypothetical protein